MSIDIGIDGKDTALRMLVFQALESYKTEALFQFLSDRSPIVRTAAARHLQTRGDRSAFERATKLAASRKKEDREIAAFILGQLGTPNRPYKEESVPVLTGLCDDEVASVREAAIASLGHLNATACAQLVRRMSRDPDSSVREMARHVQGQLKETKAS